MIIFLGFLTLVFAFRLARLSQIVIGDNRAGFKSHPIVLGPPHMPWEVNHLLVANGAIFGCSG